MNSSYVNFVNGSRPRYTSSQRRVSVPCNKNSEASQPSPEEISQQVTQQVQQMQDMMQKSPEMQKALQQGMQQMQQYASKEKYEELAKDPELEEFFQTIKTEGPAALMRFMNDPKMLAKFAEKIGDPQAAAAAAAGAGAAPTPSAAAPLPEEVDNIETLLDAAKYGDMEAIEDFLYVQKDINMTDEQGRTPLHYAVAHKQVEAVKKLIEEGADVNKQEEQGNTPVHYAAGYGRLDELRALKGAGADASIQNGTGKKAYDVAKMDTRNPVSKHKDLMDWLKGE